jgi:hypothetical protein
MILHINRYALHGLISQRDHSNVNRIQSSILLNMCIKPLIGLKGLKGLCYNCDDKYFPGHKCKEQKLFMAISEDISEEDVETPLVFESPEITDITPPLDPP